MPASPFPWLKRKLTGTRFENFARQVYLRLNLSQNGVYDRESLAVMRRCLNSRSNCIDIGAYRGGFLREMVRLAPEGTHFAFEPIPAQYSYLVKSFPQVKIYPLALSQTAGQTSFCHIIHRPTTSGFKPLHPSTGGSQIQRIQVQTELLDNVIPTDMRIDFIKVDVEGAEYQVFAGAVGTLQRNRPTIIFEHGRTSRRLYGVASATLFDLLTSTCGLRIFLMRHWLQNRPPLSRSEFVAEVEQKDSFYFMACS